MNPTMQILRNMKLVAAVIALLIPLNSVSADSAIKIGMSTALSGPAKALGESMQAGILSSFNRVNAEGGIAGKKLQLIALDDGYEPERTVPNMWRLIKEEEVISVLGNVGTPTAIVAVPIANEAKVPFVGAFTGAGVLRKTPPDRWIVNYRASYAEETAAMVASLIEKAGMKPEEIAFFTQRDGYGDAGFYGGLAALKSHGLKNPNLVAHGRYERNTIAVEGGFTDIMQASTPPKAIIMVGAYKPCAAFIKLAKEFGYDGLFLNVSFVGSIPLAESLESYGEGVIITQVVPHYNSTAPVVKSYKAALAAYDSKLQPTFGSLEGYLVGEMFIKALKKIEGDITRERIITALEGLGEFDLGTGSSLQLNREIHQASNKVWPSIIKNGAVVSFSWSELTG